MRKITFMAGLATIGLVAMSFIAPKLSTDTNFEGVITYSVTVDNPQYAAMMQGSSMKIYLKGEKEKSVSDMGMMKITSYSDHTSTDKPIVIEEMGGNKYQVKRDDAKDDDKAPDFKYVDGTKEIAGYTCHKAQITSVDAQGQSITSDIYYADGIISGPVKSGEFKGLKGFPLEFTIRRSGMGILMSATNVKKQSVSDDTFIAPKGYKLMTQEEIFQDAQKNMGGGN